MWTIRPTSTTAVTVPSFVCSVTRYTNVCRQVMWCVLGLSAFDELLIIFTGKMSFRVILCVCDEGVGEIQHSLSVILRPNYICQNNGKQVLDVLHL